MCTYSVITVAIHNKNGQGLLPNKEEVTKKISLGVAIHNKNGQGLLRIEWIYDSTKTFGRNPQ